MAPTTTRCLATLTIVAPTALLACASASISTSHAGALAVRDFCARPPADTSCTVQNTQRLNSGYIVTIDRRPPSGNDRINVSVSNGGATTLIPARQPGPGTPTDTTKRGP